MGNLVLDVVTDMSNYLDSDQIEKLKLVLSKYVNNYDITEKVTDLTISYQNINNDLLKKFFAWKLTEGLSEKTLKQYKFTIDKALNEIAKPIPEITENDIFLYIAKVKFQGASNTYLRNIRQNLSCIFTWLYHKHLIEVNPMDGIGPIKVEKIIKEEFSDIEIEKLKQNASNNRDRAIIELLLTTGMRISELVGLDRNNIDMINKKVKVYGKGSKERTVYFNNVAGLYIEKYLNERTDNDPALFVGIRKPYKRLDASGIQRMLKALGKKCGVAKVHPHRFRRTLATNLLRKGMTIEEVSKILGHEKLDTTMIYCNINKDMVKNEYARIMG